MVGLIPSKSAAPPSPEILPLAAFKASDGAVITIGQNWRRWFPPEREAEFKGKYRI